MKIIIRFIKFIFVLVLGISLSYLLTSCKEDTTTEPGNVTVDFISVLPIVSRTANDYESSAMSSNFGNLDVHRRFAQAYSSSYSASLKESVIGYMLIELRLLGGDTKEFMECYNAIGEFTTGKCLPCYAESAKYEGKDAWIIVFNWGIGDKDFGHIAYYAVDKSTKEILLHESCK